MDEPARAAKVNAMKRALAAILIPGILVSSVAVGVVWWDRGAPPGFRPTVHEVRPTELTYDHRGVSLVGTAHYPVQVTQRGGSSGQTWWIYPVFERGDTMGRYVLVLVRSTRQPDPMLAFEDVRIDGLARPPGSIIGPDVRKAFVEAGYELDERLVLVEAFED
jgi:hypothetical protein